MRIALTGVGRINAVHASSLRRLPLADPLIATDANLGRARDLAEVRR
jgi:hypothetical protein